MLNIKHFTVLGLVSVVFSSNVFCAEKNTVPDAIILKSLLLEQFSPDQFPPISNPLPVASPTPEKGTISSSVPTTDVLPTSIITTAPSLVPSLPTVK